MPDGRGFIAIYGYAAFCQFCRVKPDAFLQLYASFCEFALAHEINQLLSFFRRGLFRMLGKERFSQIGLKFRAVELLSIADQEYHAHLPVDVSSQPKSMDREVSLHASKVNARTRSYDKLQLLRMINEDG